MKDTFEKLEIPNYKHQIPKHFFLEFGIWSLVPFVFWNLEFGVWCLLFFGIWNLVLLYYLGFGICFIFKVHLQFFKMNLFQK